MKERSDFYVSKYSPTGLASQCKKCLCDEARRRRRVCCPPEEAALEKFCRCVIVVGSGSLRYRHVTAQLAEQ